MKRTTEETDVVSLKPEQADELRRIELMLHGAYTALEVIEEWLKAQLPEGQWGQIESGGEVFWDDDALYKRAFYPKDETESEENEIVDYTAVVDKYGVLKLVKRITTVD